MYGIGFDNKLKFQISICDIVTSEDVCHFIFAVPECAMWKSLGYSAEASCIKSALCTEPEQFYSSI